MRDRHKQDDSDCDSSHRHLVILGQIREAAAIASLSTLVNHPELAAAASRAITLIQRQF